ncbi:MAG: hypothetical protein WB765_05595 [Acidimicrobiales bacterium]
MTTEPRAARSGLISPSVRTLTSDLLAPARTCIGSSARQDVRDRLLSAVPPLVEDLPAGEQVVITLPVLRQARQGVDITLGSDQPFAWKPTFVRRSLGLAAIESCLQHRHATPAEAVGAVADEALATWARTGWRTFHWEPWFGGLPTGGRSVVLAEAATWATALWSALDWNQFASMPLTGGPDDQWICTAARTVRLKGRCELRVGITPPECCRLGQHGAVGSGDGAVGSGDGAVGSGEGAARSRNDSTCPPTALVSVSGGVPAEDSRADLGFLALVASLRSPSRPVPARVAGLWPDVGAHRMLDVDGEVLGVAADKVIATVSQWAASRRSSAA